MVMRLSGFSNSGIDIDDTVKKLVAAARIPQDKLKQKKQSIEWQRDAYRDINTKLMSFRDLAFNMKLQSNYQAKKATSVDDTSVSVSGTATAVQGNYTIEVKQLATSGKITSDELKATTNGTGTLLSDLGSGLKAGTTLTVGGSKGTKTIEVKPTDTLGSLISKINDNSYLTGVNVSYDSTIDKLFFTSSTAAGKVSLSMKPAGADSNPLASVLKISGAISGSDGSSSTGSYNFMGSVAIDSSLGNATKTVRVSFGSATTDIMIDKNTTYEQFIQKINKSDLGTTEGVIASLDSSSNNIVFNKSVTMTDTDGKPENVPSQLTKPDPNRPVPLTSFIDSSLTTAKTLRVNVGTTPTATTADFRIDNTTTIGSLIDSINTSAIGKLGVTASLDSNHNLVFTSDSPLAKTVKLTDEKDIASNVLPQFNMVGGATSTGLSYSSSTDPGKQAIIKFNGELATYDSNSFLVNGLNVTIKKETPAIAVNVSNDTDAIYNNIKNFVDKYNELIDLIDTKTTEKKYKDFAPLTDDQRSTMKEDQITAWESKAKSGMLHSDDILKRALQSLRTSFSSPVSGLATGDAKLLADIGISSSLLSGKSISGSYLENGKLYIDDAKLKKAIAEKPDQVMTLFTKDDKIKESTSGDGIATRLNNLSSAIISTITAKAGVTSSLDTNYTLGKTTKDLNNRIDIWTTKLDALQTRYYTQFTAMEKYMNQMSAQSSQLTQQMGG